MPRGPSFHKRQLVHPSLPCVPAALSLINNFSCHQQTTGDDDAIPIRWQCPEAVLSRVYTAKSDVYSYGVLLFEIYSGGVTPYSNLAASEVLKVVKAGHRLARPRADMAEEMFALMRACTGMNVGQRPSMATIHARLSGAWMLDEGGGSEATGLQRPLPPGMAMNSEAVLETDEGETCL